MINNRPELLHKLKYYKSVPEEFLLTPNQYPSFLANDIHFLHKSTQPWTNIVENIYKNNSNHKQKLVAFYKKKNIQFQLVYFVANAYDFREIDGVLTAVPYALSIVPSSKTDISEPTVPELALLYQESDLLDKNSFFTNFNPFEGNYGLWSSEFFADNGNSFTDELGLIIGAYFLASDYDHSGVILPSPYERNEFTQKKFLHHREKKYFESFTNAKPRKIWGADSPIELFMLQALSLYNEYPELQTIIYEDGSIHPNYYEMITENEWVKGRSEVTEVDIYFPKEKIAIFCDSIKYHRKKKRILRDEKINKYLTQLSIEVIRFTSTEIVEQTDKCAQIVIASLKQKRI